MRHAPILAAALPLLAGLAACGGDAGDPQGRERRSAAGEVLGGEIGDAMLPLDTVRSTSPPAPRAVSEGQNMEGEPGGGGGDSRDGDKSPSAADVGGATPAPQPVETLPPGPSPEPGE